MLKIETLGAIAAMVLKFLGLGKKSEYFLEAKPDSPNGAEAPTKEPEAKVEHTVEAEPTQSKAKSAESVSKPSGAEPSTKEAPKASAKPKAKEKAAEPQPAAPAVKSTPAASKKSAEPVSTTFATNHLLPLNTPRRRPGPSLEPFKDMAREMNTK